MFTNQNNKYKCSSFDGKCGMWYKHKQNVIIMCSFNWYLFSESDYYVSIQWIIFSECDHYVPIQCIHFSMQQLFLLSLSQLAMSSPLMNYY